MSTLTYSEDHELRGLLDLKRHGHYLDNAQRVRLAQLLRKQGQEDNQRMNILTRQSHRPHQTCGIIWE